MCVFRYRYGHFTFRYCVSLFSPDHLVMTIRIYRVLASCWCSWSTAPAVRSISSPLKRSCEALLHRTVTKWTFVSESQHIHSSHFHVGRSSWHLQHQALTDQSPCTLYSSFSQVHASRPRQRFHREHHAAFRKQRLSHTSSSTGPRCHFIPSATPRLLVSLFLSFSSAVSRLRCYESSIT